MKSAASVSSIVYGSTAATSVVIGRFVTSDVPRSPRAIWSMKSAYCASSGLFEAEPLAQRGPRRRTRLVAEDDDGRIARHHPDQDEHQRQHRPQGRQREQQPVDDEAQHEGAAAAGSEAAYFFLVVSSVICGPRWIASTSL